jgi:hypothetical protein
MTSIRASDTALVKACVKRGGQEKRHNNLARATWVMTERWLAN